MTAPTAVEVTPPYNSGLRTAALLWTGAVAGLVVLLAGVGSKLFPVVLVGLLAGGLCGLLALRFTQAWQDARKFDKVMTRSISDGVVFGRPGSRGADADTQYVQRITADTLEGLVSTIPGAKLLHNVVTPNAYTTSHVILVGLRALFITARVWPPGTYGLDRYGDVTYDGRTFPGADTRSERDTVAYWSQQLDGVQCVAVVLIYPNDGGGRVMLEDVQDSTLALLPAASMDYRIRGWTESHSGRVDRKAMYALLGAVEQ